MRKSKEELIQLLQDKEESQRMYAVEDILDSGYKDLSIPLVQRLKVEKSPAVKVSIVSVLQRIDYPLAYPEIFQFFSAVDPYLRNSAVSIFSSYDEDAVAFLSSYLDHSNREVRKLIIDCLAEIAVNRPEIKENVLIIIRACLHDNDINVMITAVEYIGKLEDKDSLDDVLSLWKRKDEPMLRSTILDVILKIANKEIWNEIVSEIFPEDYSLLDPLYIPQFLRILARAGKIVELIKYISKLPDIEYYGEDVINAVDWILKNEEGLDLRDLLSPLILISKNARLKEDLKYLCAKWIIASGDLEAIEYVKEWSKRENDDFKASISQKLE